VKNGRVQMRSTNPHVLQVDDMDNFVWTDTCTLMGLLPRLVRPDYMLTTR